MIGPEQCDEPACDREQVVYGMCVDHAPRSWCESILANDPELLTDEQIEAIEDRVEEGST